ncbi:MAG: outer membrane protein assembly factor BamA [Bacteroidota bacterium]
MSKILLMFLVAGMVVPYRLTAQPKQAEVYKILGISVEGNSSAEPAAIIGNSGLKIGDDLTIPGDQTTRAIQALWRLRIFSDIQIAIENRVSAGVFLVIKVKEYPRLERIDYVGNDELSADDLNKKVTVIKGQLLTPSEINRIVKAMKKAYEEEGYLQVSIIPTLTEAPDANANKRSILRFTIDEGRQLRVGEIRFTGNTTVSASTLKGEMKETSERTWWKFWNSARLDKKKYEEDKKLIITYYKKNGYRDAEILSDSIYYDPEVDNLVVQINLYEGPQYYIRSIVFEGSTIFKEEALLEIIGMKKGDVFDGEKFQENLYGNQEQTDVLSAYRNAGYLLIRPDLQLMRAGGDSLDIVIRFIEGNQFTVRYVEVQGNTKTRDKVVRRELYTRPGDKFSQAAIMRSYRQLQQLQYFNPEKIKPDYKLVDDKTVDIVYEVEEKSSDTFNTSIGYSQAWGLMGSFGITFNNFSLSDPLAGGGGQTLNFDWQFGEASRYRTFSISFTEPWLMDVPTTLGVSLFDTRQNYGYDYRMTGASLRVGRRFRWPDDYFRGDWTFRFQQYDVVQGLGLYSTGQYSQFSLGQVIQRNSIDNPIFPTSGSSIALNIEISGKPLPGRAYYQKAQFSTAWYTPLLNSQKLAFALTTDWGIINKPSLEAFVPLTEVFYMGGTGLGYYNTTPLRGYDDRIIGPRSSLGAELGGLAMVKYTAEIRYNVSLSPIPIYLLVFAEAGNVWKDFQSIDPFQLYRSAGFGARLMINPIGMVGFDYGFGFDDASGGANGLPDGNRDGWKFHFQFGRGF